MLLIVTCLHCGSPRLGNGATWGGPRPNCFKMYVDVKKFVVHLNILCEDILTSSNFMLSNLLFVVKKEIKSVSVTNDISFLFSSGSRR